MATFTDNLFATMYDGRRHSRPADKPIICHYNLVEIPLYKLDREKLHEILAGEHEVSDLRPMCIQIVRVEGLLKACTTSSRGKVPDAASGVSLKYSTFDKGHIIGLELGGVDHERNIVPQCRYLQQSGEWRQDVERAILKIIKEQSAYHYRMTVDLIYGRDATNPKRFDVTLSEEASGNAVFQHSVKNDYNEIDIEVQNKKFDRKKPVLAKHNRGKRDLDTRVRPGQRDIQKLTDRRKYKG